MLPILKYCNSLNKMIIYGSRDVPEIINSCSSLKENEFLVKEVNRSLHNDIFTVEDTFKYLIEQLKIWFQISEKLQ